MLDRIVIPIEAPYVDDETSVFNLTRVQAMQDIQQSWLSRHKFLKIRERMCAHPQKQTLLELIHKVFQIMIITIILWVGKRAL